eukprot:SAG31_NODE_376_length_16541_cov_4.520922_8_plen_201_part_00
MSIADGGSWTLGAGNMAASHGTQVVPDQTVEAMAAYLRIQLPAERYLLWVARQACLEPLPAGWSEHKDEDQNTFYFNAETQESTYTNPLDETFLFLIEKERKKHAEELAAAVEATADGGTAANFVGSGQATRPKRGRRAGMGGSANAQRTAPAPPTQHSAAAVTAAAAAADPAAVRGMAEYMGINPVTQSFTQSPFVDAS